MTCDICNKEVKGTLVSADEMRRAAANGFNPFELGLIPPIWAGLGVTQEKAYLNWRHNQVAKDTTDWDVCNECMVHLKKYLQAPEQPSRDVGTTGNKVFYEILENDVTGGKDPISRERLIAAIPATFDTLSPSEVLLIESQESINTFKTAGAEEAMLAAIRAAAVVCEFVISRHEGSQYTADAFFHKAVGYVALADRCRTDTETDLKLRHLKAAHNSIIRAMERPTFIQPQFLEVKKAIALRLEQYQSTQAAAQVPPPDHVLILVGGNPPEGREAHGQKVFRDISPVQGNFLLTIQSVSPDKAQQSKFIVLSIVRIANSQGFDVDTEKTRIFEYTSGGVKGTMIFIYKQLQTGRPSTRIPTPDLVFILVGGNPPEGREAFGQKVFRETSPILGNFPLIIQSVGPGQAQDERFMVVSAVLTGKKQGFDVDVKKTRVYKYELGGLKGTMLFMYKQGQ